MCASSGEAIIEEIRVNNRESHPLPIAKVGGILILIWKADHVPTLQPLSHASAKWINRVELHCGRAGRLWRHFRLRGPGERPWLTGMSLASNNCSPQLAEELIDLGPQEHGHQGHQDWHQTHQLPKAKLNDKDEDASEEEKEDEEEVEEKPVNQEPPSVLQDTPNLRKMEIENTTQRKS